MADDKKARELLEKIRRLPHNKRCANCDVEAPPGGFGDVCVKFLTFTCHTCKSAHQSFSHRCKSVSLSNWTTHEVLALKDEAGGGNAHARKTWLGKLEGMALVLRPGDPLDKVKAFVDEAYNRKRYWQDDTDAHSNNSSSSAIASSSRPTTQGNHSGATPSSSGRASGVRPPTPPLVFTKDPFEAGKPAAPAAAPADFLDLTADFSAASTAGAAAKGGGGEEEWQPFQQGNGSAASAFAYIAAPPAPASHAADDHFGDFMAAPGPVPAPPLLMPQQAFKQQQQQQQEEEEEEQQQQQQPVMLLGVRALGDDPFAGLQSHPPQQSTFGPRPTPVGMGMGMGMNGYGQQPQQQRPAPGMGVGVGMMPMAASRPPMRGVGMHSQLPMNGFAAPTPTPAQRSRPVPTGGGMGGGMGGFSSSSSSFSSYKPQQPDPFASLDAVWRNK